MRGEGVWLYDAQGKPYLDAYNNVVPLGHCHRAVVEAIARQASTLNTHTRYVHETVLDYAEALLATRRGRAMMFTAPAAPMRRCRTRTRHRSSRATPITA